MNASNPSTNNPQPTEFDIPEGELELVIAKAIIGNNPVKYSIDGWNKRLSILEAVDKHVIGEDDPNKNPSGETFPRIIRNRLKRFQRLSLWGDKR